MDARITKTRLANFLSYDWLKIIAVILAAVFALFVFFTTLKTRPGRYHTFTVYGYKEILEGSAMDSLEDDLESSGALSYDVLSIRQENMGTGQYSDTAFNARRAAGEGTVMFTTTNVAENAENGETVLQQVAGGSMTALGLDVKQYLYDCEQYLMRFFGSTWREGEPDAQKTEECFLARNGKDKRFRTRKKKEIGILQEAERLEKLRSDYIAVRGYFDEGMLGYAYVTDENGNMRANAVALGKLARLQDLCFYIETKEDSSVRTTENVCLLLLHNDDDAGVPAERVENDLRYEAVSFLRYLVEKYGN